MRIENGKKWGSLRRRRLGWSRAGGKGRRRGQRLAIQREEANYLPLMPDKDLHLIFPRQPAIAKGKATIGKTETARGPVPRDGLVRHQLPVAKPKRRPLYAREHIIVRKNRIDFFNGID